MNNKLLIRSFSIINLDSIKVYINYVLVYLLVLRDTLDFDTLYQNVMKIATSYLTYKMEDVSKKFYSVGNVQITLSESLLICLIVTLCVH